ncbi:amine oxidase [Streptomyces griseocarneus]|nr:amine oxidase [Streptomyces griseocarneus]
MAGLVAACELERLRFGVTIFEADNRVGGRVLTHRFGSGPGAPAVELGAMRIPDQHRRTLEYIERVRLGDKIRAFTTLLSEENAFLATGDGFVRVRDASPALCENLRREWERSDSGFPGRHRDFSEGTIAFGAWLTAIVDAVAPPDLREALRTDLRRELLDRIERIGPGPWLPGADNGRVDLHGLFGAHPEVRAGCSARLDSFLDDILTETGPSLLRLRGGMDQLPRRLARGMRSPVVCGREVVGIDVREHDVLVHVRAGDRVLVQPSDFAVCTVPFPALRRIRLTGVDADKLAVLREVVYCPATKVALHCREPFWQRQGIRGGASFTAGAIRQTYYPPVEGDPERGAALLASYTIGDEAGRLGRLPEGERHRAVLQELAKVHPELLEPGMVLGAASAAWGTEPWSVGCATRWGKDAAACEEERLRAARPAHRLFFAGEHCSTAPAWIEGAIESAQRAVADLTAFDGTRRRTPLRAALEVAG